MVDKGQDMFSLARLNLNVILLFHCSKLCNFRYLTIIMDAAPGIQPFKNNATFPVCRHNILWPNTLI